METRKEKYRKYREEIIHMADEFFPSASEKRYAISAADEKILGTARRAGNAISFGDMLHSDVEINDQFFSEKTLSPYAAYRERRRKGVILKLIALALVVIGLIVWYFLIQGRL